MSLIPWLLISLSALQGCGEQGPTDGEDGVDIVYPDADNDGIMDNHEAGWGGSMEADEVAALMKI